MAWFLRCSVWCLTLAFTSVYMFLLLMNCSLRAAEPVLPGPLLVRRPRRTGGRSARRASASALGHVSAATCDPVRPFSRPVCRLSRPAAASVASGAQGALWGVRVRTGDPCLGEVDLPANWPEGACREGLRAALGWVGPS